MIPTVAILFAQSNSIYKQVHGCDVWDASRDALRWPGGMPVVAHPPCRSWGRLSHMAKPRAGEKELALFAVEQVRTWGGVLEHPEASRLWDVAGLPPIHGLPDQFGGVSWQVDQFDWGHRARKRTWLYVCGQSHLPAMPPKRSSGVRIPVEHMGRPERERTPIDFATWLVSLARGCNSMSMIGGAA